MIHMKHEENGYHIAYTQAEARKCEKDGWKRCDIKKEYEKARKAKGKAKDLDKALEDDAPATD